MKKLAIIFTLGIAMLLWAAARVFAADTYTTNYGFRLPDLDIEDETMPWGLKYNNNWVATDATMAAIAASTITAASEIAELKISTGVLQADLATEVSNRTIADAAIAVSTGINTAAIATKVNRAGDTMTGGLYGPLASFSSVTATEFHGDNVNRNEGLINTPNIVDDEDAFYVAIGTAAFLIRDNADNNGSGLLYRTIAAEQEVQVTAGFNVIYIDWSGGTPVYVAGTEADLNYSDKIPVADLWIDAAGAIEYKLDYGHLALGGISKNTHRIYMLRRFEKESGLALTESAGRRVIISAGVGWFGNNFFPTEATDSTTDPMYYYRHGNDGEWAEVSTGSYLNEYYDTPTGTQTLTANRYAVNWIYRNLTGTKEVDIVLGTGDYTLAQAEASQPQTPPDSIVNFYYPVGRIIVQKGAATATAIEIFADNQLNYAGVMEHNDLLGLQGGAAGDYQHLTSAELTAVGTIGDKVAKAGDTMTGGLIVSSNVSAGYYQILGSTVLAQANSTYKTLRVGTLAGPASAGVDNVMVGYEAGRSNTTGETNTFVGTAAGYSNTLGIGNTYLGKEAGLNNTTGVFNTAVGINAGNSGTVASSGTYMGYYTGTSLTTGSGNIFMGWQAGDVTTTGSDNIIIGNDADAPAATTSNHLNIASLLTGTIGGSSVTAQGTMYANSFVGPLTGAASANVLKAGDTMTGPLTLSGSSLTVTGNAQVNGSSFSVGGSTLVAANGRVGIGDDTPDYPLDVEAASARANITSTTGTNPVLIGLTNTGGAILVGNESSSGNTYLSGALAYSSFIAPALTRALHLGSNGNVAATIISGGNFGINTTAPTQKLEISSGTIKMAGTGTPTVSKALCLTALGVLGTCTDAPNASGGCTCATP